MVAATIRLLRSVVERLELEVKRLGVSLGGYVLELAFRDLDLQERAWESIEVARGLLGRAREELEKGNVGQAAEKAWDAAALTVKAYAW